MIPSTAEQQFSTFPHLYGRKLIAVLPAYNEEAHIEQAVMQARAYADVVIVVDDDSTDDTAELAQFSGAHVISTEINLGKDAALLWGLTYARQFGADVIISIPVGHSYDPKAISKLLLPLINDEADIVLATQSDGLDLDSSAYVAHRGVLQNKQTLDLDLMACSADVVQGMCCGENGRFLEVSPSPYSDEANLTILEIPVSAQPRTANKPISFWQKLSPFRGYQFT